MEPPLGTGTGPSHRDEVLIVDAVRCGTGRDDASRVAPASELGRQAIDVVCDATEKGLVVRRYQCNLDGAVHMVPSRVSSTSPHPYCPSRPAIKSSTSCLASSSVYCAGGDFMK